MAIEEPPLEVGPLVDFIGEVGAEPFELAVSGFESSTVDLSPRNTTVSMTQVVPPTIANFSSSRCLIAIAR